MAPMLGEQISMNSSKDDNKDRPRLYDGVDQGSLSSLASKCLINYGTKFEDDIITGTKGLYIYTASGHRVLDWTSGQMSCLIGHGHS